MSTESRIADYMKVSGLIGTYSVDQLTTALKNIIPAYYMAVMDKGFPVYSLAESDKTREMYQYIADITGITDATLIKTGMWGIYYAATGGVISRTVLNPKAPETKSDAPINLNPANLLQTAEQGYNKLIIAALIVGGIILISRGFLDGTKK